MENGKDIVCTLFVGLIVRGGIGIRVGLFVTGVSVGDDESNGAGVVLVSVGDIVGDPEGDSIGAAVGGFDGTSVGVAIGGSAALVQAKTDSSYLAVSSEAQPDSSRGKNPIKVTLGRTEISPSSQTYDRTGVSTVPCAGYSSPKSGVKWYGFFPKYVESSPQVM